jgi:hypothetical protein
LGSADRAGFGFGVVVAVRTEAGVSPNEDPSPDELVRIGGKAILDNPKEQMFVVFIAQTISQRARLRAEEPLLTKPSSHTEMTNDMEQARSHDHCGRRVFFKAKLTPMPLVAMRRNLRGVCSH